MKICSKISILSYGRRVRSNYLIEVELPLTIIYFLPAINLEIFEVYVLFTQTDD